MEATATLGTTLGPSLSKDEVVFIAENYTHDNAWLIVLYQYVEFTLHTPSPTLGADAEQYVTNVNVLEGLECQGREAVIQAHQALRQYALDHFADRMQALASVPGKLRTVQDAADCVEYTLSRVPSGGIEVTKKPHGPTCHLLPLPRTALQLRDDIETVKADKIALIDHWALIAGLVGEARMEDESGSRRVFFKPAENGKSAGFQRALSVYSKLSEYPEDLRRLHVPQLLAVVTSLDETSVLGFLTEWVDAAVLADIDSQRKTEHRNLWVEQGTHSVKFLHKLRIIWGDVNAHNVLIDGKDRVWIVNLSGGVSTEAELEMNAENSKRELEAFARLFDQ